MSKTYVAIHNNIVAFACAEEYLTAEYAVREDGLLLLL